MKKLILILLAIILNSCTADEIPQTEPVKPTTCEMWKFVQMRQWTTVNGVTTYIDWTYTGTKEFYSNNCADEGKIIPWYGGSASANYEIRSFEFRYIIKKVN